MEASDCLLVLLAALGVVLVFSTCENLAEFALRFRPAILNINITCVRARNMQIR